MVRDLQFADKWECRDIFTVIGNLGELFLEVVDVRLEGIALSYFDSEEVMVILLHLPTCGVFGEERLGCLLEIVERAQRQIIKSI